MNLVRPDRAKAVEQYIIRLAQSGQVRRKLGEDDIVEILNGIARDQQKQNETKIVVCNATEALSEDCTNKYFSFQENKLLMKVRMMMIFLTEQNTQRPQPLEKKKNTPTVDSRNLLLCQWYSITAVISISTIIMTTNICRTCLRASE